MAAVRLLRPDAHSTSGTAHHADPGNGAALDRPLRFTIHAAAQCARQELNVEWVETTLAFPAASGMVRGGPTVWFMREFGTKRVRVWAINQQTHRTLGVIHVDVTAIR